MEKTLEDIAEWTIELLPFFIGGIQLEPYQLAIRNVQSQLTGKTGVNYKFILDIVTKSNDDYRVSFNNSLNLFLLF
jgi:hypothetical protein